MFTGLRMLVICGAASDADRLRDDLLGAGYDISLQWTNCENVLRSALNERNYDLVLCDNDLPNLDIVTARGLIAESGQDIPFIVISEEMTPEAQLIASQMKAGVDDFVEWGKPERLIPAVERSLHTLETRRQNRLAEQEMRYRANFDSLTELPNRTLMLDRLSQAMKKARRDDTGVLLMFLDLDHFKNVNDSMGHLAGDLLLRQAAKRISACLRDTDTAARIGGDEFAIILPDADQESTAEVIAGKILKTLSKPFGLDSQKASISASIGITLFPRDGEEADILLKNADQAMYAAKRLGRNAYKVFNHVEDPEFESLQSAEKVFPLPQKNTPPFRMGAALAAAIAIIVVASVWLTSMNTKESLKVAIEENLEVLTDFTTASGPEEEE